MAAEEGSPRPVPPASAPPEPAFDDPRAAALSGLLLSLATAATGGIWWNLAGGRSGEWHLGVLGVLLTPVAALAAFAFAVRLVRGRPKR
ncbi:MAG TPA: hypothetical protein VI997_00985 [Candidatus Thermoplasmatota archaeon]|nr:hypothetical protein [Candidatus Thermoplasmatota archaeon]